MKINKSTIGLLFMALVITFFSGCSRTSLPSPEQMENEVRGFNLPKLPENGKAIVYVVRPNFFGMAIKFNIYIDDKKASSEMGYTYGKEYIYFNLLPGKHKILSLAENWDSVEVNAKAGDIIFLEQEFKMGVMYGRNKLYDDYSLLEGKYRVKTLSLGTILKQDKEDYSGTTIKQDKGDSSLYI